MKQFTRRPETAETITKEAKGRVAATMQLGERQPNVQEEMVRKETFKVRRERERKRNTRPSNRPKKT